MKNKGFTLLTAIIVTSILMLVSFVVANIALKQLLLTYAGQESQYAFYNADSGVECAQYWDIKNSGGSAFATSTTGTITCSNQTVTTGNESLATFPPDPNTSQIGGGGDSNPTSIFGLNFDHGCVLVKVTKAYANGVLQTTIESHGYNTCDLNADRRFERGIRITY